MGRYPALDVRFSSAPGAALLEDLLHAELDAFEPLAIHEHDASDGWRVFFPTREQRDEARAALAAALGDRLLALSAVDVEDDGWARRSQASLEAVHVGRITVAPPWDLPSTRDSGLGARDSKNIEAGAVGSASPESRVPNPDFDRILIVIDPSMGFGTGHHATTRLCLELMQRLDFAAARVLDIGTGSGVLALAAWKLGAAAVTAVDHDPDALQNARDNIARNGGGGTIQIVQADLSTLPVDSVDVVLANLTAAVLQRHAGVLRRMTSADLPPEGGSHKKKSESGEGRMVVSGFSPDELEEVTRAFGLVPRVTAVEGEWAAAVF